MQRKLAMDHLFIQVCRHHLPIILSLLWYLSFFPVKANSATVNYTYDSNKRLIQAIYSDATNITYTYDASGNRVTQSNTGSAFNIYENAEDNLTLGWDIYDADPAGAEIVNIYDNTAGSRVIELSGTTTSNGFRLRNSDGSNWNDTQFQTLQWSMNYNENFIIYIATQTTKGFRYLQYTPVDYDKLGSGTYVHFGVGSHVRDGSWRTLVRDLQYDLRQAQPDNDLQAILGFLIRGSGRLDDIFTQSEIPPGFDSDGDTLSDVDEINIYGTDPYNADTDNDAIDDDSELNYWGEDWNLDSDNDGTINILDDDSDNDGMTDAIEISQGTDPRDSASFPTTIVYESAEDGNILGWAIYDPTPAGASISNTYDELKESDVIELSGSATANGYRLGNRNGDYWDDAYFKIIQWSMRYSENFIIYIAVDTKDGFRYIRYTTNDYDKLGQSTYIDFGLGSHLTDGQWHTIIRDLEYDLKTAQPSNELLEVLGFLIRGSGRVDDIMTREAIPAEQDSDADVLTDLEEITIYGSNPHNADSDGDTLDDDIEISYWGSDWNSDPDGDGLINLLDPDSDNDGFEDGIEVTQHTDPASATSFPTQAIYEDGEDETTNGWEIYDADPVGASINNVYDETKGDRVIVFSGSATNNGYRLLNNNQTYWNDDNFKTINWSMNFEEPFIVYIATETKDGFRYLRYTPVDYDNLGTETYVHHGLGSGITDGTWRDFSRNLELDLKEAQPDNELKEILGFLIRGNGRVDDIKTTND